MSFRFTSDTVRKKVRGVRKRICGDSEQESEHAFFELGSWRTTDGASDSFVGKGASDHLNRSGGKFLNGEASKPKSTSGNSSRVKLLSPNASAISQARGSIENHKERNDEDEASEGDNSRDGDTTSDSEGRDSENSREQGPEIEKYVDPRSIYRQWSDEELSLQRRAITRYEAGDRLWTKEGLLAIEEQINFTDDVRPVTLPAFVGESYKFERELGLSYMVDFHGYYNLAFPPGHRPNGMPYCSMHLKTIPFDYSDLRDPNAELDAFHKCTAIWLTNPLGQHFYSMFMRLPLPPYINKIVCLGLGDITSKPANNFSETRYAMYRHAAVLTIVEVLHKRFGSMIQLYAQDIRYCKACAGVLYKKGFSVVGAHGAAAFAQIDESTLVFAPDPGFCVKEIVADIAEPAAMFWGTVLSPEEDVRATRSARVLELGDRIMAYYHEYRKDPDTPRVRALINKYDWNPFPTTNLFGEVSFYTRKGVSVESTAPS
ncbi:hypothetical protein AAE478_010048 [Parahypoxylon ruwenzoriense]